MNKIWVTIIILSALYGIFFGNVEEMVNSILNVPKKTLELLLLVGGLMIFWNGIFNIAIESGLIRRLSKLIMPFTKKLFSKLPSDHIVHEYICANICANVLGLGNAATPMGIKALDEMKKLNEEKPVATKSMITLVLLNTTNLTLFPATLFSLREIYKSNINIKLLPFFIVCTILSIFFVIIVDYLFRKFSKED